MVKKKNFNRVTAVILSFCMAALVAVIPSPIAAADTSASSSSQYGLADSIQQGTILHCFDWKYCDIKDSLADIAKAGFTSVQTSPAQPDGSGKWYWLYQPQAFCIGTNGLGTKADLQQLCTEAEKYGINVIVDVVANHLNGNHSSIQDDLKGSEFWHNYGSVSNWADRYQVIHGEIGMADLATENSYVEQCVAKYVQELKAAGVDGIRWDAAKHIGLPSEGDNFWKAVTAYGLYNYGEILGAPDDRKSGNEGLMKEYTNYISVTDSNYGKDLRDSFANGSAPTNYGNWSARGISADKLIYWGESHDTWSNNQDWGFSNGMSQNVIDRAYAIAASRADAAALYFSRPSSGNKDSIMIGEKGSTHFTSPEVAAVNHFHNAMAGQKDYFVNSNGCAVVCRNKGAVIVKGSGSGNVSVENGGSTVAPGTYTDEITGNTFTVTSSSISGEVGSSGIAVIYNVTKTPSVSISQKGGNFKTDSIELTATLSNATSGTYSINGGASKSFTSGTKFTIGKGDAYGTTYTVKLTATDGKNNYSETYTFKKVDPTQGTYVYFKNSAGWSDVYCYMYSGKTSNAAWPGEKMTKGSDGLYCYEVPSGLENGNVLFASAAGGPQIPGASEPGLVLSGNTMLYSDGSWKEYSVTPVTEPTTSTTQATEPTTETPVDDEFYLLGDANGDGKISLMDIAEIAKQRTDIMAISGKNSSAADVNGDSKIDNKDIVSLQNYFTEITVPYDIGKKFKGSHIVPTTEPTEPTTASDTVTVTYKNTSKWSGTIYLYYWNTGDSPIKWPGIAMTLKGKSSDGCDIYTCTMPAKYNYVIFSNGKSQTPDTQRNGKTEF